MYYPANRLLRQLDADMNEIVDAREQDWFALDESTDIQGCSERRSPVHYPPWRICTLCRRHLHL
jgi:hypothetical protein